MKKIIFTILLLAAGRLYAISPIGPAASTLQKGQWDLGFDYAHTQFDDMPMDVTIKILGLAVSEKIPLSDDVDGCWAKVGYGLVDRADIFLRLGAADVGSTGGRFAWGLGGRATILKSERLDWGLLAQVNWFSGADEETVLDPILGPLWGRTDWDLTILQIAAGPVYKGDGFSVYGGPFLNWLSGGGDITLNDGVTTLDGTFDMESDLQFGGYVGFSLAITDNVAVNAEAQFAEHTKAVSLGLKYQF